METTRADKRLAELSIIASLKLEDVDCTYTGKPGCMCGCLGVYSYPTATGEASAMRAAHEGRVSPRSVKIVFNKVVKHPDVQLDDFDGAYILSVRTETRQLAVYMKKR